MCLTLRILFFLLMFSLASSWAAADTPTSPADSANYQLAISFDPERHQLTGTARITLQPNEGLTLDVATLKITGILIKNQYGDQQIALPKGPLLTLPQDNLPQDIYLSYAKTVSKEKNNLITPGAITLLDNWHPVPDKKMRFQLSALLPAGFVAVTESDRFPLARRGDEVSATFSQPQHRIHFAAAPYTTDTLKVRDDLTIHTLFFVQESKLAAEYLTAARTYLLHYERTIGPYPYNHYIICANQLPTGLAVPTFTLLGRKVLQLPFIRDTALGHEIVHSWFGNSVEVAPTGGNWSEGLTAYLADHARHVQKGEGARYRKKSILNYLSYIHADNVLPLMEFKSADPGSIDARASQAVGYSRGALLFHQLKERITAPAFDSALRLLYRTYRGKEAGWPELAQIFSAASGQNLASFFDEQLHRTDLPSLSVSDIQVTPQQDHTALCFILRQQTQQPYSLSIPIRVTTPQGVHDFVQETASPSMPVRLILPRRPTLFALDPDYSFLRQLAGAETPPVWSRFLGSNNKLAILPSTAQREIYEPLLAVLQQADWTLTTDDKVSNASLAEADLLFLGPDQQTCRSLFGRPSYPDQGLTLDVRANPLNPSRVAVLLASSSRNETAQAARRLSHYGSYSSLNFLQGTLTAKSVTPADNGQIYRLEQLPAGGATSSLTDFSGIIDQISNHDVIYIGENHTALADHLLQLRIIEALAARKTNLVIGMEMFPAGSQEALDSYVSSNTALGEKQFLKQSGYFDVWGYDYRYYREIFNLARQEKIPIIALNAERKIVSTVFRTGSTDALDATAKQRLPAERDLDLAGYTKRLATMHTIHLRDGHTRGKQSGFIQAQAIWDETMAERISRYLAEHPGHTMVVLAGNQHTRKDSGIPPRVSRRIPAQQATIVNISDNSQLQDLATVADYYFLAAPQQLPEPAKMGLVLEEKKQDGGSYLTIVDFSPQSKAEGAGLRTGDTLLEIDDYPVQTMADVRIAMIDAQAGKSIAVRYARGQKMGKEAVGTTELELVRLEAERPHP